MTPEGMRSAGKMLEALSWTDEELAVTINGLYYVIPFMEGIGGNSLILEALRNRLHTLEQFQNNRENEK